MKIVKLVALGAAFLTITACVSNEFSDLELFMEEVSARPAKPIKPIPLYPPYKSFTYSAMSKRAPFDSAVAAPVADKPASPISTVRPNDDRAREYLETFSMDSLALVGHLTKSGTTYGLIQDGEGSVHAVTEGNYLGRNHGRIVSLNGAEISMVEIVSNGGNSWVERTRTLALRE